MSKYYGYLLVRRNAVGRTICGRGGPSTAAIVGPGGPIIAPDQIKRDRPMHVVRAHNQTRED